MPAKFLTTAEAAQILGVNSSRVRQLILEGRIKATKHGAAHLIASAALKAVAARKPGRPAKRENNS